MSEKESHREHLKKVYMDMKKQYLCKSIMETWNGFDIDEHQDFSQIVEDYDDSLSLDINQDWLLWELELQGL